MADAAVTIVGGGVVGLAIAAELSRTYDPTILLERHAALGQEASGRNSEVIHAGLYYPPGSLKASLCVEGRDLLYDLCARYGIPQRKTGKIITASSRDDFSALDDLFRRGTENGVPLERLSKVQVSRLEPAIRTEGGIFSPSSGIISAHGLMDCFRHLALAAGGTIQTGCAVTGISRTGGTYRLDLDDHGVHDSIETEILVNAAGLEADTVASMAGIDVDRAGYRLSWVKGSYFSVAGEKRRIVRHLVYPMPGPDSLGIHAVVDLGDGLRFGPDVEYLTERVQDYRVEESKRAAFAKEVRTIIPDIGDKDLFPDQSGIRAKLQKRGEPPKDFIIRNEADRGLNGFISLIGIDSPGLTSSAAIARHVRGIIAEL